MTIILLNYTYFILNWSNCFYHVCGTWCIWAWNAVKLFIKIELHIAHFEIMASDFQISRHDSILDNKGREPLPGPKSIKLVVLTADFDGLSVFIITLGYLEQSLVFSVGLTNISL